MPRIIPLQLLKCLKVLLDDNGGILSASEVKRIAGLMTKYSKKLVSKCIYVQILKCTKTELLGEFMGVGGWTLVYTWLNDGIRAMNWPLVQEILELLLLCPVDVHRLKINSAPKLVKGLCKDGGNEAIRILARRLVEQWLKVVTDNNALILLQSEGTLLPAMMPQVTSYRNTVGAAPPIDSSMQKNNIIVRLHTDSLSNTTGNMTGDKATFAIAPTPKKSSETGLVYKIVVKNGQQVLAKIAKPVQPVQQEHSADDDTDAITLSTDNEEGKSLLQHDYNESINTDGDDDSKNSNDRVIKDYESSGEEDDRVKNVKDNKLTLKDDGKNADRQEQRTSRDSKEREKDRKSDKSKERKSSSNHKTISSHKSSSKSSSSSSSKSKSSSHRSSSDKHRSDKDRSSSSNSSKDKDRKEGSSSSSSKYKSSSKSSSSSSSSKDRHKEKDKVNAIAAASPSKKDKEKELVMEKEKSPLAKVGGLLDKLGKIPKKPKEDVELPSDSPKATSITIPSKKASISIEIRRDCDKANTVKTYKSQFRSHGLTEEAPPPPSRKGLKKPSAGIHMPGTIIPSSLPSSLKRRSPPPRDAISDKKAKLDVNNVHIPNEKPGVIKLIPPKKMQTLVETNLFSDALSAATGPKKLVKRKKSNASVPGGKEAPSPPTSPEVPKAVPLKFYQDTLEEGKNEEKSDKENEDNTNAKDKDISNAEDPTTTGEAAEDDDDIPLKKMKEDIEQKVLNEKKLATEIDALKSNYEEGENASVVIDDNEEDDVSEERKPGPGCGPNGPPGVLMLHRRKGPKKKLTWRPQEQLEQIRYFELDETERVNVTKSSFNDMKSMERFGERDAINIARRGFNNEDNMQPQIPWTLPWIVDNVPPHPNGNQSKEREEQAKREQTTLRALYFSHAMIPDSPAEAELQPTYPYEVTIIPLDDITGNPDAINDFTRMPWPEPKGMSPHGDNIMAGGLGGLDAGIDMFSGVANVGPVGPFNPFINQFGVPPQQMQMQMGGPGGGGGPPGAMWQQAPPNGVMAAAAMMGNHFNGNHLPGSPGIDMSQMGPIGPGTPPQNFMGQFVPVAAPVGPQFIPGSGPNNSPFGFNGPNFGPMGGRGDMMNGPGPRMHNRNMNSGGGWRSGPNFHDNKNNNASGNWRPAGSGPNRSGAGNNNNGICKAFLRGHCRLGKACKFIHPMKNKRI